MNKNKHDSALPGIKCFVNTGARPLLLDSSPAAQAVSSQKLPAQPLLTYGQYLESVSRLLSQNSFQILRVLLAKQTKPAPQLKAASSIELMAEKHGALYSVSRLLLRFPDEVRQFAVNCAFSSQQQAFLQVETALLAQLRQKFPLPYLPSPFLTAQSPDLMLFIADWFENHHEFHLSANSSGRPAIKIWRDSATRDTLDPAKVPQLYAQASRILTCYLDPESFSQIYPWHHAAGDFIIDDTQNPLSLRLITLRGYRPLMSSESDSHDKLLGALHFFVNLCIRMRIDRLDGVGELAWAGPECLPGIVCGFMEAWKTVRENTALPEAEEIFSLFLALSPQEKLAFAQVLASHGMVEADETDFLRARLPACMAELAKTLQNPQSYTALS